MADCTTCQPSVGFEITNPLPGTPVGRYVVPLVRINAKIDEMKPGMVFPLQYIDLSALTTYLEAQYPNLTADLGEGGGGGEG